MRGAKYPFVYTYTDAPVLHKRGCRIGCHSYNSSITDTAESFDNRPRRTSSIPSRQGAAEGMQDRLQIDTKLVRGSREGHFANKPNSNHSCFIHFHVFSGSRQNVQPQRTPDGPQQTHRSCASVPTAPSRCTTRIPPLTRPKIVCLLSRYGVGASVMKNCDPKNGSVTRTN